MQTEESMRSWMLETAVEQARAMPDDLPKVQHDEARSRDVVFRKQPSPLRKKRADAGQISDTEGTNKEQRQRAERDRQRQRQTSFSRSFGSVFPFSCSVVSFLVSHWVCHLFSKQV